MNKTMITQRVTFKYQSHQSNRRMPGSIAIAVFPILDEVDGISTKISTGEGKMGGGSGLSAGNNWWRCRDLNPGHCGYEPHALTN